VKHWITFNEIHSFAGAYFSGNMAPGRCSDRKLCAAGNSSIEPYLVSHHALLAHAHTVHLYRKEFQVTFKSILLPKSNTLKPFNCFNPKTPKTLNPNPNLLH